MQWNSSILMRTSLYTVELLYSNEDISVFDMFKIIACVLTLIELHPSYQHCSKVFGIEVCI